ncbi:MAG: hypothetical protein A4E66_02700 [Syntrophus sp. PtaB.Bin001]|nr:MAG: hypothetical protein A4E66_02700 [Syntrophus sp. PtaB.Bin001]
MGKIADPHEKNEGSHTGQRLPVNLALFFQRIFVARHESNGGRETAMRQRNARVSRNGNRRGHAGNDLKGNTGKSQFLGFFPATAKNERIAAFQAGHNPALAGLLHQLLIDLIL